MNSPVNTNTSNTNTNSGSQVHLDDYEEFVSDVRGLFDGDSGLSAEQVSGQLGFEDMELDEAPDSDNVNIGHSDKDVRKSSGKITELTVKIESYQIQLGSLESELDRLLGLPQQESEAEQVRLFMNIKHVETKIGHFRFGNDFQLPKG